MLYWMKGAPPSTIAQLDKIQQQFTWKNGNPTLCNECKKEGLKNVAIFSKIKSLMIVD